MFKQIIAQNGANIKHARKKEGLAETRQILPSN